jgi:hypothetical protein
VQPQQELRPVRPSWRAWALGQHGPEQQHSGSPQQQRSAAIHMRGRTADYQGLIRLVLLQERASSAQSSMEVDQLRLRYGLRPCSPKRLSRGGWLLTNCVCLQ